MKVVTRDVGLAIFFAGIIAFRKWHGEKGKEKWNTDTEYSGCRCEKSSYFIVQSFGSFFLFCQNIFDLFV